MDAVDEAETTRQGCIVVVCWQSTTWVTGREVCDDVTTRGRNPVCAACPLFCVTPLSRSSPVPPPFPMAFPVRVTVPDNPDRPAPLTPTREMLAHLGVSPQQFERRQEQMRRSFSSGSSNPFVTYVSSSLPFPLNLPPSYSVYSANTPASAQPTRPHPQVPFSFGAFFSPSQVSNLPAAVKGDSARALGPHGASSAKPKGKLLSLDAFMESRQLPESESSSSECELSLGKVWHAFPFVDHLTEPCAPTSDG